MAQYSGLFDGVHATGHTFVAKGNTKRKLSMLMRRTRNGKTLELLKTLIGASTGGTAYAARTRVAAHDPEDTSTIGGVRSIETIEQVNRVTTAADVTDLNDLLVSPSNSVFVADASGVGGGGKLGY